ncbi:MAG: transglycosylase domain-containing protein [Bacteroidota bacterium]
MFKRILKFFLRVFLVLVASISLFLLLVASGLFGELPTKAQLANIKNNVATEIYSADGKLIGKYYIQNRSSIAFEQISTNVINALIATEDARFYDHNGIDPRSLIRVLLKTVILQDRSGGGGSTISQQLVKNMFPREDHGIWTIPVIKAKESILAYRLESIYSKDEILTFYLNTVPFGDNVFGIETASKRFFNKPSSKIQTEEAAVLIGMLKANYTYNPRLFPKKSLRRRNVVLMQMHKYDFISKETYEALKTKPLKIDYQLSKETSASAAYFKKQLKGAVNEWIKLNPKSDGTHYNLYTDGLKIYTTIDSRLQAYAEKSTQTHMKELQKAFHNHWKREKPWDSNPEILKSAIARSSLYKKLKNDGLSDEEISEALRQKRPLSPFSWDGPLNGQYSTLDSIQHYLQILHAGVLALNPNTGAVKAWVGGIDFDHFQYDHVARSTKRQVGSTFKPFVYANALERGYDPCAYTSAARRVYTNQKDWTPNNADEKENILKYSYKGALSKSVNTVAVKVLEETGIDEVVDFTKSLGVESEIPELPSIALGTPSISLFEMTQAYAAFANGGNRIVPQFIARIENSEGKVLAQFDDIKKEPVMESATAGMITEMMREVVKTGTGSRIRWKYGLTNHIAGKTGTTQSNADGWFIGYNPELVVGVWVGADDPRIRFRTSALGSGANMALPIFAKLFQHINFDPQLAQISKAKFSTLDPAIQSRMSCDDFKDDKNFLQNLLGLEKKEKVKEKEFGKKKKGFFQKVGDLFKGKKKKDG